MKQAATTLQPSVAQPDKVLQSALVARHGRCRWSFEFWKPRIEFSEIESLLAQSCSLNGNKHRKYRNKKIDN